MGSNKESKRQPKGTLVWRTGLSGVPPDNVRCTTGQCPVHQGTRRWTPHLQENGKPLRYNSPDSVRWHTGLSGVPAEQWLLHAQRSTATHLMRACTRRGQSTRRRRTGQSTGPVRCTTGQPGGPTSQSSNGQNLTAGWRGWRTGQCPVAHRTVRCAMRQTAFQRPLLVVGAINTPTTPHSLHPSFQTSNPLQEL
jgi:hypothetical protein